MIITFPRFCFGHQEQKNKMAEMKLSIRRRGEDQSRRQTGRAVSVFSGRRVVIKRTRGWGGEGGRPGAFTTGTERRRNMRRGAWNGGEHQAKHHGKAGSLITI